MRLARKGRWFAFAAVSTVLGIAYLTRAHTPSIDTPNGIASLESVELGGYEQAVLIRGRDTSNPVLLFLHGGPGMPAMYLSHAFQRPLEADFIVVQWDQRGAGKSYRADLDLETLRVSQLLADATDLVDTLRTRFGQDRIYLVGHSWGSYLGTLLAQNIPERLSAYVGVGQVVGGPREDSLQAEFILRESEARGVPEATADIRELGSAAHEKWLFRFGAELTGATSWVPLLMTGLKAPEYSLRDVFRVAPGSSTSSARMVLDVIDGPLGAEVSGYEIPAYFFTGRSDWTTPYPLIIDFVEGLDAPHKEVVWFSGSAHFPFFEEPNRFAEEMRRVRDQVERSSRGTI